MSDLNKYRLGNQLDEYVLVTDYLEWKPVEHKEWFDLVYVGNGLTRRERPFIFTLASPEEGQRVSLVFHQALTRSAFPLSFFGEERAKNWGQFAIVSLEEEPWALFVIPLH